MTGPTVVTILTKKYAHLRGEYDYAERDAEPAMGIEAIDAVTAHILKRKKVIHRQLEAIEIVLHLFDPTWDFAKVKPIRPKNVKHKMGDLAQLGYDFLRERNNEPATGTQLGRGVVTKLGIEQPSGALVARYARRITTTFSRRSDVIKMLEGIPRRWMLRNFVSVPSADAFSSSRPKIQKQGVPPRRVKAG
jgi:hypothetical protein